ncbi:hypothetical protein F8R89_30865 [Streptomyces sp. SS1-1]|uniref:hypothetical protein n=1 Tax=Streptomyces sp. SS1-1 TaxID=2651869 RepID=UPI001250B6B1|nr:hypothetical protein [Streptomyces sp. SS1-1]KAB2976011.1 hypothetical protein F8R89_30865 [Streptomyces sp. SS1-1]
MSDAELFIEAITTFTTVAEALAGWVIFFAVVAAILTLAATVTGARAVRGAWRYLRARVTAERAARAVREGQALQHPPHARTARRTPAWVHTQPADKEHA